MASPASPRFAVSEAAPGQVRRDAPFRAAEILGRMMGFFEEAEACSHAARRMAATLLGAEVDRWREARAEEPGHDHLRGPVVAAAVAYLEAGGGHGKRSASLDETRPPAHSTRFERDLERSFVEAGRIHLRVHQVLDLAAPHHARVASAGEAPVAAALAHLLDGAEPRTWSGERLGFARCVVEYLGGTK